MEPVSSDRFTFKNRVFVAEASGFGRDFKLVQIHGQAESETRWHRREAGFTMKSAKTGKCADFYLERTDRDQDGDVTSWFFRPTPEAIQQNPGLLGTEVCILND